MFQIIKILSLCERRLNKENFNTSYKMKLTIRALPCRGEGDI
jgi:hypothetical protein